jgi:hypothetical protein
VAGGEFLLATSYIKVMLYNPALSAFVPFYKIDLVGVS